MLQYQYQEANDQSIACKTAYTSQKTAVKYIFADPHICKVANSKRKSKAIGKAGQKRQNHHLKVF